MAGDAQKWEPETRETADHSMPYTVAVALTYGDVSEEHFDKAHLRDPKLRELTRRVKVSEWEEANRRMPEAMLCRVSVTTRSGATHECRVEYHRGHWRNPMSDTEVEAKYRRMALQRLPAARVDELAERVWRLDETRDVGDILRLTVTSS
jgi:2-methylcitrate dehydratase